MEKEKCPVAVGQTVRFDKFADANGFGASELRGTLTEGTVVYINEPNGWFSVEYLCGGVRLRDSFWFNQVGTKVKLKK